jgi:hypothetical protein
MTALVSSELLSNMLRVWKKDHSRDKDRTEFKKRWKMFLASERDNGIKRKRTRAKPGPLDEVEFNHDDLGLYESD